MALEIIPVQTPMPTSSSGTTDLAHGSITTTPSAAINFLTSAIANNTARNVARLSIGATDGTDEGYASITMNNNVGDSDTNHVLNINGVAAHTFDASAGEDGRISHNAFIAGGERVNNDNGFGNSRLCNSIFFAGCTAKMVSTSLNGTDAITVDPGMAWKVAFFFGVPRSLSSAGTQAEIYFGFYNRDKQACIAFNSAHGAAAGDPSLRLSSTYVGMELGLGTGSVDYGIVASLGAGTECILTPDGGGGDTDHIHCLFLGWDTGETVDIIDWDSPTVPGNDSLTGFGLQPQALINLLSFASDYDTAQAMASAGAFGISVETEDDQLCTAIADEWNSLATDTQSMVDITSINVESDDGTAGHNATFVSMDVDGVTRNWPSPLGIAYKQKTLAFSVISGVELPDELEATDDGVVKYTTHRPGDKVETVNDSATSYKVNQRKTDTSIAVNDDIDVPFTIYRRLIQELPAFTVEDDFAKSQYFGDPAPRTTRIINVILRSTLFEAPAVQSELALSAASYLGNENAVIPFTILRTQSTTERMSIDWAITNATVTPNSGTQIFEIGSAQEVINIIAGEVSGTEIGTLTISNAQNLSGGQAPAIISPFTASFTVINVPVVSSGRIVQNGAWLEWPSGTPFFMCGCGDPEGFLYLGTRLGDGTRSGGQQQQIIDEVVLRGASAMYMQIVRSNGGDGGSTENPFISSGTPSATLNQDILDQWRGWFEQLETAKCAVLLFLYDDSAKPWAGGATVPADEQGFITNLVNEYKDLGNIVWCIAEEWYEAWSSARNIAQAGVIRAVDPEAVIANHGQRGAGYDDATGFGPFNQSANFNMFSTQENPQPGVQVTNIYDGMFAQVRYDSGGVVNKGAHVVNLSEARLDQANGGNPTQDQVREYMWMTAMAGCYWQALEISGPQLDPTEHITFIVDMGHCARFFNATDFSNMIPDNAARVSGASRYTLIDDTNNKYISWTSNSGLFGITSVAAGSYQLTWRDCVSGATQNETISHAGGTLTLARPSGYDYMTALYVSESSSDWAYRSTLPGVMLAANFATDHDTDILPYKYASGNNAQLLSQITFDTTDKVSGAGCLKILHRLDQGQGSGSWWRWLNGHPDNGVNQPSYPNDGTPVFTQYQIKFSPGRVSTAFTGTGCKTDIIAGNGSNATYQSKEYTTIFLPSNSLEWRQYVNGPRSGDADDQGYVNSFRATSIDGVALDSMQPQIDHGDGLSTQLRYSHRLLNTPNGNFVPVEGEWMTLQKQITDWGDGTADIQFWAKNESDASFTHILGYRDKGWKVNSDELSAISLLTYQTDRIVGTGVEHWHKYDELLTATHFLPAPKSGGAPTWFTDMPANTWEQKGQSALAAAVVPDVNRTQNIFDAYNGFVADTDRNALVAAACGGHGDGKDNGVYAYELMHDAAPQWAMWAAPTPDNEIIASPADGRYADGTPASTHTLDALCYVPSTGKIMLVGMGSIWKNGNAKLLISSWSHTDWQTSHRGWDTYSYGELLPGGGGSGNGMSVWDPVTNLIFNMGNNGGTAEAVHPENNMGNLTRTVAVDDYQFLTNMGRGTGAATLNYGLAVFWWSGGRLIVLDTTHRNANGKRGKYVRYQSSVPGAPSVISGPPIMWHEPSDAFLLWPGSGTTLYKLRPASWSAPDGQWSFSPVSMSGVAPDQPFNDNGNGCYHKVDIIPNMGNGEACIVAATVHDKAPWVLRLTGGI